MLIYHALSSGCWLNALGFSEDNYPQIISSFLKDELPTNVASHVGHCDNVLASFSPNNAPLPRYEHLSWCLLVYKWGLTWPFFLSAWLRCNTKKWTRCRQPRKEFWNLQYHNEFHMSNTWLHFHICTAFSSLRRERLNAVAHSDFHRNMTEILERLPMNIVSPPVIHSDSPPWLSGSEHRLLQLISPDSGFFSSQ